MPGKTPLPAITHRDLTLITERRRPFSEKGWIFELKYDGFRCLATHAAGVVSLLTRNGTELAERFPELVAAMTALPDLVLDGELVVLDAQGRPRFERLRRRAAMRVPSSIARAARVDAAAVFAFDLLWLAGRDLRALPLLRRKAALQKALGRAERIRYLTHVGEQGERLYEAAAGLDLEGIVAKRADAPYRAGRSRDWVKIKTPAGRQVDEERAKWNEKPA